MKNYTDPQAPPATGEFAATPAEFSGELIVVTYNLRYGEAIDEMIDAFRTVEPLPEAGIILLQEMDAAGVDMVARELGYNYVYYPASVAADGDDFGNAILARWPISDPAKLILPGLHPITGQGRTATRATVTIDGTEVLVYSTHVEVATAPPSFRAAQFAALLDDVPDDAAHVIAGGDFNTVTGRGVNALAEMYAAGGLSLNSADLGPTYTRFGLRPSAADHIFSRGFEHRDAGVLGNVTASDHFPVWVRLEMPSD
jgi:endonuclease/exonuclease/phosphatase family metal-dependent hydrolase